MSARLHSHIPAVDSIFLHFHHEYPHPPIPPPASRTPSKPLSKSLIRKPSTTRSPLSDKTRANNVTLHDSTSPHSTLDCIKSSPSPTSSSFRPPLPIDASPVDAPSFMDFSCHTFTTSPDLTPLSPFFAPPAVLCPSPEPIFPTLELTDKPLPHPPSPEPPEFTHPNSPYVPWTSPVRREILRPITPASMLSAYSRPYSRSGARAPEPMESREELPTPHVKFARVTSRFKIFRMLVKSNVKEVTKRFKSFGRPLFHSAKPPPRVPRGRMACSTPALPSPALSGESTQTASLAVWLAECRQRNDDENGVSLGMTIEEYDRMGSWVDLCRIPEEYAAHDDEPSSATGTSAVSTTHTQPTTPSVMEAPSRRSYSQSSPQLSRWTEGSHQPGRPGSRGLKDRSRGDQVRGLMAGG